MDENVDKEHSNKKEPLNFSQPGMALTELPGNRKFYLFQMVNHVDVDGSVWIVGTESGNKLAEEGVDEVLRDPELKNSAAIFIFAHPKEGNNPGLRVDFYNSPNFRSWEHGAPIKNRGKGVVDALVNADKKDALRSSTREMFRGLLTTRAIELEKVLGKNGAMSINNVLFDNVSAPEKAVEKVFEDYEFKTSGKKEVSDQVSIEISLPLNQFLE